VAAEQFAALAVSRRRLERIDDESGRIRGLHDAETGETFLIAEQELRTAWSRHAPGDSGPWDAPDM
jgi:hypothetical protein